MCFAVTLVLGVVEAAGVAGVEAVVLPVVVEVAVELVFLVLGV